MNIVTTATILQLSQPPASRADVAGSQSSVGDTSSPAGNPASGDQNALPFAQVLSAVLSSTSSEEASAQTSSAHSKSASQDVAPCTKRGSDPQPNEKGSDPVFVQTRSNHSKKDKASAADAVNALLGQQPIPVTVIPPVEPKMGNAQALPTGPSTGNASPQTAASQATLPEKANPPAIPSTVVLIPQQPEQTLELDSAGSRSARPALPAESAAANSVTNPAVPGETLTSGDGQLLLTARIDSCPPAFSTNSINVPSPSLNNPLAGPMVEALSGTMAAPANAAGVQTVAAVSAATVLDSHQILKVQNLQQNSPVLTPTDSVSNNGANQLNSAVTEAAVTRVGLPSLDFRAGFAAFRQTEKDLGNAADSASAAQPVSIGPASATAWLPGEIVGAPSEGIGHETAGSSTNNQPQGASPRLQPGTADSTTTSVSQDSAVPIGNLLLPSTSVRVESLPNRVSEIVGQHLEQPLSSESSSVVLRLDPPELGRVHIHVSLTNDVVSIRMVATDEAARQIIERQLNDLHQSLANQGISFTQCQVDCNSSGHQSFDRGLPKNTANEFDALPFTGRRGSILASNNGGRAAVRSQLDYVA